MIRSLLFLGFFLSSPSWAIPEDVLPQATEPYVPAMARVEVKEMGLRKAVENSKAFMEELSDTIAAEMKSRDVLYVLDFDAKAYRIDLRVEGNLTDHHFYVQLNRLKTLEGKTDNKKFHVMLQTMNSSRIGDHFEFYSFLRQSIFKLLKQHNLIPGSTVTPIGSLIPPPLDEAAFTELLSDEEKEGIAEQEKIMLEERTKSFTDLNPNDFANANVWNSLVFDLSCFSEMKLDLEWLQHRLNFASSFLLSDVVHEKLTNIYPNAPQEHVFFMDEDRWLAFNSILFTPFLRMVKYYLSKKRRISFGDTHWRRALVRVLHELREQPEKVQRAHRLEALQIKNILKRHR